MISLFKSVIKVLNQWVTVISILYYQNNWNYEFCYNLAAPLSTRDELKTINTKKKKRKKKFKNLLEPLQSAASRKHESLFEQH